jgi:radical SAM protein with 4Fe4S-binding SPASM domain
MSESTLDRVIDVLRAGVDDVTSFNITLSGGEPSVHPRFIEFVRRISEAGFPITIITNGQRFAKKDFLREVLQYNIWNFQFSIEGSTAEKHDERVACPGAWGRLLQGIENALESGVRVNTNTTMTYNVVDDMFSVIDLLDEIGVPKMSIGNTLPECAGRNWKVMMEYPEVVEIAEELTLYALTKRIAFSFITPLPLCLKSGRTINNPSVCSAGAYSTVVDVDGTFRPCSVCEPAGFNLPKASETASYQYVYERLKPVVSGCVQADIPDECRECASFFDCKACCPLYWKVPGVQTPAMWRTAIS